MTVAREDPGVSNEANFRAGRPGAERREMSNKANFATPGRHHGDTEDAEIDVKSFLQRS